MTRSKTMTRLPAGLRDELRRQLLARQGELSRSVSCELDDLAGGEERHHPADMDDLGGDALDEETHVTLIELESTELEKIRRALDRMDEGSYGSCELCDRPIAEARLRAYPLATNCIDCQRIEDASEELPGG